jgi:hypothetical protein
MGHVILRQAMTALTVPMLFVQSVASGSCECGQPAVHAKASCCQTQAPAADCCSQLKSCSKSSHCGCGDSDPSSKCACGCGDDDGRQPYTPGEKSERNQSDVHPLLHLSDLVADTVTIFPEERLRLASTPHTSSGSHSVQAILCIWQT